MSSGHESLFVLNRRTWVPSAVAAGMLALAAADAKGLVALPSQYFAALRVVACAAAIQIVVDAVVVRYLKDRAAADRIDRLRERREGARRYWQAVKATAADHEERRRQLLRREIRERDTLIDLLRTGQSITYGAGRIWTFAAVAVLFNPFQPIFLDSDDWLALDAVGAFVFGFMSSELRQSVARERAAMESEVAWLEKERDNRREILGDDEHEEDEDFEEDEEEEGEESEGECQPGGDEIRIRGLAESLMALGLPEESALAQARRIFAEANAKGERPKQEPSSG